MSEVRCPMCGKPNPPDREVCGYCQARLKPLLASSGEEDWRRDVFGGGLEGEPDSGQELDAGDDLPDWLKELRPADDASLDAPLPIQPEQENIGAASEDVEPGEQDRLSDWLKELRQKSAVDEALERDEKAADQTAFPEPPPDWLATLGGQASRESKTDQAEPESSTPVGAEIPDWLTRLEARQREQEGSAGAAVPPFIAGEEQAALSSDEQPVEAEAGAKGELQPLPEETESPLPDWLSGWEPALSGTVAETGEGSIEETSAASGEGEVEGGEGQAIFGADMFLPQEPGAEAEEEAGGELEEIEPGASLPHWVQPLPAAEAEGGTADIGLPEIEEPAWLTGGGENEPAEGIPEPGALEGLSDLSLDWLQSEREALELPREEEAAFELPPVFQSEMTPEEEAPLLSAEVPDWLGETPEIPLPPDAEAGAIAAEAEAELAKAEMPSWLEAMRPVDAAALATSLAPEGERRVEGSGPLAGLRSVLPGDFEIGGRKVPTAYTVKLQVSESQKAHAALIAELIKAEGEPTEIAGRRMPGFQRLLMIGIFVLLSLGVLWPLITGSQSVAMPYFSEVYETSSAVNSLGAEKSPVLVAVDYEPGLSGEMEATANAIIDHLMIRGAYLTLVSTAPTGAAQAERLLQGVNQRSEHSYTGAEQYANLGYLPGGALGIRAFAESPRRLLPFAQDGRPAWDTTPLSGIRSIADFALILVLTDDPLTARVWIEQVQPLLGERPLLMVVSAQVEPVVRPYFDAQPRIVAGFVAGLPGGASYEQMFARYSLARTYWDAYSFGISLIAVMLLVGGAFNALSHLISNRKMAAREAKG